MDETISLRPATAEDESFLFRVFAAARDRDLALLPWPRAQKNALIRSQFEAQRLHYDEHYHGASCDIILRGGEPAGLIRLLRGSEAILVVDVGVLPAHRHSGVASGVLMTLQREAALAAKRITCHCEMTNVNMIRLVERLGFHKVGERGPYWACEWVPRNGSCAEAGA